ncbi:hypothetical protein E3P99_01805 [Wallemia hederae]|uniref:Peroxisomal adenine nucleotide transporter 1 n=1 Tax=Wallemia hederae TaxID=1540922 RepID=A0A4T0FNW7_9BASI|nr:hypothetical protein E3P99_01805 [Wallemia hederae]
MSDELSPLAIAFSGALGAVVSNGLVYPLDTVKTRIQAKDASDAEKDTDTVQHNLNADLALIPKDSLVTAIVKLFRDEGIAAAYGGFGASMLNTFSQQFAYFYWYGAVRTAWLKSSSGSGGKQSLSTASELLIGAIAGDLAQIFTIPVNVIATRQQIGVQDGDTDTSFIAVGRQIIKEDGITGLWRGLKPSLVLSGGCLLTVSLFLISNAQVNPAITYGAYEKLKAGALAGYIPLLGATKDGRLSPWGNFVLGAMSKTAATIATYPYIMAKVRVMAGTSSNNDTQVTKADAKAELKKNSGALKLLLHIYKKKGVVGWYKGMHAQIVKAVLQQALLFVLRDIFEKYTLMGVLLIRSLRAA